jgi:DNA-binding response OmpR family regulator
VKNAFEAFSRKQVIQVMNDKSIKLLEKYSKHSDEASALSGAILDGVALLAPVFAGSMLVLTDDNQEFWHLEQLGRQMQLAAQCFDNGVTFVNEVVEACLAQMQQGIGNHQPKRLNPALIVFAGNLPAWVHLDLYKRMQTGGDVNDEALPDLHIPPVLFVTQTADLERIANYLHGDLLCMHPQIMGDLLERPARDGEFLVRAKSLLLRHSLLGHSHVRIPSRTTQFPVESPNLEAPPVEDAIKTWGAYVFDVARSRVFLHGVEKKLSFRQFRMALILFSNMGKPVSRADLGSVLFSINGQPAEDSSDSRVLDAHAYRLRKVLELTVANGYQLESVYRVGYVIRKT